MSSLFLDDMQHWLVVSYWHFKTAYWSSWRHEQ